MASADDELAQLRARVSLLEGQLADANARITSTVSHALDSRCTKEFDDPSANDAPEPAASGNADSEKQTTFVVLGASGDLARKKTFPVLFMLFVRGLLPSKFLVVGYSRTQWTDDKFRADLSTHFKKEHIAAHKDAFLAKCFYHAGKYDSLADFQSLDKHLGQLEAGPANRIFYYAIPPSVFIPASQSLQKGAMSRSGYNRVVVEKPFGKDLESSRTLSSALAQLFSEDQLYRIDHYLGKELVQNMLVLRFANAVFEPLWNSAYISTVQITFKEDFGTQGRGGYFDEYGIIRDVMQNHLLQVLSLTAMEPPVSLSAEDIRDEKVKVLRAIPPIELRNLVIGQYGASSTGKESGYLEDPTVPKDSVTPTFASAVLHINNPRWRGTPFILKCGKALNDRKTEIRIQFRRELLFPNAAPNELVMRVQPNECLYIKLMSKVPGLTAHSEQVELDLNFKERFNVTQDLPDAYERLILDVTRGDHSLFVREDELEAAWRIFTPILHELEEKKIKPELYDYGSRGPAAADELARRCGFVFSSDYEWQDPKHKAAAAAGKAKI